MRFGYGYMAGPSPTLPAPEPRARRAERGISGTPSGGCRGPGPRGRPAPGHDPAGAAAPTSCARSRTATPTPTCYCPPCWPNAAWTGQDAAFATELTYGTLRGRGTYDAILAACSDRDEIDPPVRDVLRLGAHQLLATRVGHHAAVATSVDLAKDVCGPRPSGFVNAVLRRVATRDLDAWVQIVAPDRSRDPSGYLAVRHSYPRWIVDAFRDALGPAGAAETEDALAAGNVRPEVVLALSPAGPPDPGAAVPLPERRERTRWSPYGFRLAGGDPAPLVASGRAGRPGRGQPAGRARPDQDRRDPARGQALAGPVRGSRRQGPAAERSRRRPRRPPGRLGHPPAPGPARPGRPAPRRRGENHGVIAADGRRMPWPPGTFDRVLADVPCSGLGSLRRRPEARWRKTPADVAELAGLQRELLSAAIDSVRPGGVVAYVTCSPHLAETRDVVTAVARSRDDVTILDAPAVLAEVPDLRGPEPQVRPVLAAPSRHGRDLHRPAARRVLRRG